MAPARLASFFPEARRHRHEIPRDAWLAIQPLPPGQPGGHGGVARDSRLFVNAAWSVATTGLPRRGRPERFGQWDPAYHRLNQWSKKGAWRRVLEAVEDPGLGWLMIESTVIRSPHHAAVVGDTGYDSDAFAAAVERRGAGAVVPPKKNRVEPRGYDEGCTRSGTRWGGAWMC